MDTRATNLLGDLYGFFSIERYGAADRRHRLVTSGIVQMPMDLMMSVIADFRSSLRFNPSASFGDLQLDGYTGDLPAGILPGSGCRDLNLDAVNAARLPRGLEAVTSAGISCDVFTNVDLRFSRFFNVQNHPVEFIPQLFNIPNTPDFNPP